ncbi:hypothetical protein SY83_11100 [Paenibacillus swuensis]|uniref:Uncharacterized protein n=1 Tax=Paenibacillus swuensis TaxID=1178515 RepID=A0A172TI46_9BACL|nr:ABC transporter permease [Paenibacillus swuensis]ANE46729.1 hypothetical protein SY83_11100 [Paenibacillus swuensis]
MIPLCLLSGNQYYRWWVTEDILTLNFPFGLTVIALYLFCWTGTIRSFIHEADQLFMLTQPDRMQSLKRYSLLYSVIIHLVSCAVVWVILLPYWVRIEGWSISIWLLTLVCTILFRFIISCVHKYNFLLNMQFWKRLITHLSFIVISAAVYSATLLLLIRQHTAGYCLLLLLVLIMSVLCRRITRFQRSHLVKEAEFECRQRGRMLSYILGGVVNKKRIWRRKNPYILKMSNPLFTKRSTSSILVETRLKAFVRDSSQVNIVLQYLVIGAGAIWSVPWWMGWGVWLFLTVGLVVWMSQYYKQSLQESYMRMFTWNWRDVQKAHHATVVLLSLPSLLLLVAVVVVSLWSHTR